MASSLKRRRLASRQCSFLGNNLGNSWKELARDGFDFSQADVDQIVGKHPGDIKQQAKEALDMWCHRRGREATVGNIETPLVRIGRRDIFEGLIQSVVRPNDALNLHHSVGDGLLDSGSSDGCTESPSGHESSDDSDSDDSPIEVFTLYNEQDKKSAELVNTVLRPAVDETKWTLRDKKSLSNSMPALKTQNQENSSVTGTFSMFWTFLHLFGLVNTQTSVVTCSSRLHSLYKHVRSNLQHCLCLLVVVPCEGCLDDDFDRIVLDVAQEIFTGGDGRKTFSIICLVPSWRSVIHMPLQLRNVPTVVVADERTKRKVKDILLKCSKPHQVLDHATNSQGIPTSSPRAKKKRTGAGVRAGFVFYPFHARQLSLQRFLHHVMLRWRSPLFTATRYASTLLFAANQLFVSVMLARDKVPIHDKLDDQCFTKFMITLLLHLTVRCAAPIYACYKLSVVAKGIEDGDDMKVDFSSNCVGYISRMMRKRFHSADLECVHDGNIIRQFEDQHNEVVLVRAICGVWHILCCCLALAVVGILDHPFYQHTLDLGESGRSFCMSLDFVALFFGLSIIQICFVFYVSDLTLLLYYEEMKSLCGGPRVEFCKRAYQAVKDTWNNITTWGSLLLFSCIICLSSWSGPSELLDMPIPSNQRRFWLIAVVSFNLCDFAMFTGSSTTVRKWLTPACSLVFGLFIFLVWLGNISSCGDCLHILLFHLFCQRVFQLLFQEVVYFIHRNGLKLFDWRSADLLQLGRIIRLLGLTSVWIRSVYVLASFSK